MAQLWHNGYNVHNEILEFTVSNDNELDQLMIKHDCMGSIAHAAMLAKIGLLTQREYKTLQRALKRIILRWEQGKFSVRVEDEDGHTAIENELVARLGNLGKKIHTARSRNDQVVTMTRLYVKETTMMLYRESLKLIDQFLRLAKQYEFLPMPGYTHMQRAMPTSAGTWFDQYAEALLDDLQLLKTAYHYNDMSPLGSAAGFGVNIPIDRTFTAKLLGFNKLQNNPMYVSYSRGKVEAAIIFALNQLMGTLAKFANDALVFSMTETGFVELPKEFCTGSSLMPQKRNGDVFELTRGKANVMLGNLIATIELQNTLLSGYNRDSQLTKDLLVRSLALYRNTVSVMNLVTTGIRMNQAKCLTACSPEIFAADFVLNLVKQGMPFRDAYRQVAQSLDQLEQINPVENIKRKKHLGAPGNLQLTTIRKQLGVEKRWIDQQQRRWQLMVNTVLC